MIDFFFIIISLLQRVISQHHTLGNPIHRWLRPGGGLNALRAVHRWPSASDDGDAAWQYCLGSVSLDGKSPRFLSIAGKEGMVAWRQTTCQPAGYVRFRGLTFS